MAESVGATSRRLRLWFHASDLVQHARSRSMNIFYALGAFSASHPLYVMLLWIGVCFLLSWPVLPLADQSMTLWWRSWRGKAIIRPVHTRPVDEGVIPLQVMPIRLGYNDSHSDCGVLHYDFMAFLWRMEKRIEGIQVNVDDEIVTLADLCYRPESSSSCLRYSPLDYWQTEEERESRSFPKALLDEDDLRITVAQQQTARSDNRQALYAQGLFEGLFPIQDFFYPIHQYVKADFVLLAYFVDLRSEKRLLQWNAFWRAVLSNATDIQVIAPHPFNDEPIRLLHESKTAWQGLVTDHLLTFLAYLLVFIYISVSFRHVQLVKSKLGLGVAAVASITTSLTMSFGVCTLFGVHLSLVAWEVLPFLVMVVGVENIRLLTDAVVSTPMNLPVRERVGIGLGKSGLRMTASLVSSLSILIFGALTNIPNLRDFCWFAAVTVAVDFSGQLTFYTACLAIDMRRLELTDLHHAVPKRKVSGTVPTQKKKRTHPRRVFALQLLVLYTVLCLGYLGLMSSSETSKTVPHEKYNDDSNSSSVFQFWFQMLPSNVHYLEISRPWTLLVSSSLINHAPICHSNVFVVTDSPLSYLVKLFVFLLVLLGIYYLSRYARWYSIFMLLLRQSDKSRRQILSQSTLKEPLTIAYPCCDLVTVQQCEKHVLIVTNDGRVLLMEAESTIIWQTYLTDRVCAADLSTDWIVVIVPGNLLVWCRKELTLQSAPITLTLPDSVGSVSCLVHIDPTIFIAGTDIGFLLTFKMTELSSVETVKAHEDTIIQLEWLDASLSLVSASLDGTIQVWTMKNNQWTRTQLLQSESPISTLTVDLLRQRLYSGHVSGAVSVWDMQKWQLLTSFESLPEVDDEDDVVHSSAPTTPDPLTTEKRKWGQLAAACCSETVLAIHLHQEKVVTRHFDQSLQVWILLEGSLRAKCVDFMDPKRKLQNKSFLSWFQPPQNPLFGISSSCLLAKESMLVLGNEKGVLWLYDLITCQLLGPWRSSRLPLAVGHLKVLSSEAFLLHQGLLLLLFHYSVNKSVSHTRHIMKTRKLTEMEAYQITLQDLKQKSA